METEESGWTKENLKELLALLKDGIPKRKKRVCYRTELETLDWSRVSFGQFSSEQCQEKWTSIMKKLPKMRSLAELIEDVEVAISNPSDNIKIHPEVPKIPACPTAAFFKKNFAQLKKEYPQLKLNELVDISNKHFSNLPVKEKAKYKKQHGLAMAEYKTELRKFRGEYGKLSSSHLKRRKKKTVSVDEDCNEDEDGLPPKPVRNGYLLFCKEHSKSTGDGQRRMIDMWSQAWQKLSETEKMKYRKRSNELRTQYGIKLNNYLKRFDKEEQNKILQEKGISRKEISTIKNAKADMKLPNEPNLPSSAPRVVFLSEKMKLLKDIPLPKNRFAMVNEMWKNLSAKEKERYKAKVEMKFSQYQVELQKWFQDLTPEDKQSYLKANPSKVKYLSSKTNQMYNRKELQILEPSDSEDEDLVVSSSSDEEENILKFDEEDDEDEEEEEEEEEEEIMFKIY